MKSPSELLAHEHDSSHHSSIKSICGVCPAGCGVRVELVDGRISRMRPLAGHPLGMVCPRGARAAEIVYSPDRLLYPQRRVGPAGASRLERIGWDDAYDEIVGRLRAIAAAHGPEAIALYTGRGNFELGLNESFAPAGTVESSANAVFFPLGSPNATGVGSLCYAAYGMISTRACFGGYMRHVRFDIEHADLVLVWGANPATDSPPANLRRVKRAAKRGAQVVVIDHRRSETVKATGARWIGIRPGTDGALALGLMHLLIEEDRYDHEFVAHHTHGFEQLRAYVRDFDPRRVAAITGVPVETIRWLARAIADARGCTTLLYTGLEYSNCGVQAIRAVWSLIALAGHLDAPGGNQLKERDWPLPNRLTTPAPPDARPPIGAAEYPLFCEVRNEAHAALLPRAILEGKPYPLRALVISGSSVITAWPDPALWRRALAALDLLVVINRFPTADAEFAHLLLPASTPFENESFMFYDGYVQLRQRVIEPLGEARSDYLIFAELARRLGYGERWPQTEQAMIERALRGSGVTLQDLREHPEGLPIATPPTRHHKYRVGALRADGQPGFETPTTKFEFASEWLRRAGYDALPVYTEPREGPLSSPELLDEYPLVFNSGARTQTAFRSQHHNIASLVSRQPAPRVHLHRRDAEARGIVDGEQVEVVSPRGRARFCARVTDDIVAGVVEVNMGGGGPLGPAAWREANVNSLTDLDNRDPISGFPVYKALLCDVRKRTPAVE